MPSQHTIFEIRAGRDAEQTVESVVQLLSALPKLKNSWFYHLLGKDEHLSLEFLVQNQTIYFLCHVPWRLADYLQSLFTASYPEALIHQLDYDPLENFFHLPSLSPDHQGVKPSQAMGSLKYSQQDWLPLKTYKDFHQIDPLSTLLSVLSDSQINDQILIQFSLDSSAPNKILTVVSKVVDTPSEPGQISTQETGQEALIKNKRTSHHLEVGIKILVSCENQQRGQAVLEKIASAFNTFSQSNGNSLQLSKVYLFKKHFISQLKKRSFSRSKKLLLSLEEMATLFHLPNKSLSVIPNIAWGKNLLGEPPENLPIINQYTPPDIKQQINVFAETNYKNNSAKYGLLKGDRRRHMYVIGKTGTGKSTLLANMAINDLKKNEGLCVIDPHGDLVETILNYIPSHRINDVVYFDPSDPNRTVQINLFEGENIAHRELIASGIISIFQKLYGYSWGPRLEYILRNALLTLLKTKTARLSDIIDLLINADFREKIVSQLDDPILKSYWLDEYNKMQDRLRTESIASILNKVGQFVSSPMVRNVVNAPTSSFSIEKLMDEGKILLANLSQGKLGEDNATLLGAMLITKIQLAAMGRVQTEENQRRDFYLYVDEFQNFATTAFIKILSEARKYRLDLILANQYISQIPEEVQKAIFGNCGNIVSFVMGADDAAAFSKEYGEKYKQDDLVSLSKYQIINKISIDNVVSRPFPAYTLPLAKSSNMNREKVIRVSSERYARKKSS